MTIIVFEQKTQNQEHHFNTNSSVCQIIKDTLVDKYQLRVILRSDLYKEGINKNILVSGEKSIMLINFKILSPWVILVC